MKHKLKYIHLFEGLTPEEIPFSKVHDNGMMSIIIPKNVKESPPVFDELTDEVTWSLSIYNNQSFTEISGFNKLTKVGGYLSIEGNKSLTEVTGFDSLTQVGGVLSIKDNQSLTSVTGFNNLNKIDGFLRIENNQSLTEVTGFNSLNDIDMGFYIRYNPKLVAISIPGSLIRSVNYDNGGIRYDNGKYSKSPPEFINSPVIINDLVEKFNTGYHSTRVIQQIIENLEEWGTEETKEKVYTHLGQYLTPEQLKLAPTHIQHLYHPDYKKTSVRDVAKFNTG